MRRWPWLAYQVGLLVVLTASLHADSITLRDTNIPLPVTIERIETGRVFYRDHLDRPQYRSLDDIDHINFQSLPLLTDAAAAIDDERYHDAIGHLLRCLLDATTKTQRLWIHRQLVQTHDIAGQYVQASSHFASLVLLEDHSYWRTIAPLSDVNETTFAAAQECMLLLEQAQQATAQPRLAHALAEMHSRVKPVYDLLKATYDGPDIEPGSTVSGLAREAILVGAHTGDEPLRPNAGEDAAEPVDRSPPRGNAADRSSQPSIEQLLSTGQWSQAISECERAARRVASHDVPELLYQYGRALAGGGRPRDAAIEFTRCAILFRESPFASKSLIETAIIYRDVFEQPQVARRLLDRAENDEQSHNRPDVRERISQVRKTLEVASDR